MGNEASWWCGLAWGGDVARLVERQTGTPLFSAGSVPQYSKGFFSRSPTTAETGFYGGNYLPNNFLGAGGELFMGARQFVGRRTQWVKSFNPERWEITLKMRLRTIFVSFWKTSESWSPAAAWEAPTHDGSGEELPSHGEVFSPCISEALPFSCEVCTLQKCSLCGSEVFILH